MCKTKNKNQKKNLNKTQKKTNLNEKKGIFNKNHLKII